MRTRKKKNLNKRMAACEHLIVKSPENILSSGIYSPFPPELHDRPVCIEIGCGKGDFICETAAKNKDKLYYAIERVDSVVIIALEKRAAMLEKDPTLPDNVRFIIGNAANTPLWFPEHSIETIYINFCDPWPKKGHYKRRLTYRAFLSIYSSLLVKGGQLRLKTDNEGLFAFTLEELAETPFRVTFKTENLHATGPAPDNVMTEYEKRFYSQGMPIFALTAENMIE
ncbi:MAG: tRNA (guanosine(46)-N7)-methyltransferase TrmB [Clostridiales bacterium]|nr:tRNA (guanosine(46)-N7)-methyltransferase TrmB [Clostridiales bacterium]